MPKILIDDSHLRVIKSMRPFLGDRGNGLVSTMESLEELLASEQAQKMMRSFQIFGFKEMFNTLEMVSEEMPNAFTLFLILILLILADLPLGADRNTFTVEVPEIPVEIV